jgi:hypothetical protein
MPDISSLEIPIERFSHETAFRTPRRQLLSHTALDLLQKGKKKKEEKRKEK